jgi:rhodanese-related sulfurtransferase
MRNKPRYLVLLLGLVFLLTGLLVGCGPTALPVIVEFIAAPSEIYSGESATLFWNVTEATSISIDQGIDDVSAVGTQTVSPITTTAYTLTATNVAGTVTKSVVITVTPVSPSSPSSDQPVVSPEGAITYLTPQEAFALIQENSNNSDFVIIGVQTASHFAAGHIKSAVNIPYGTFRDEVNELDKSKIYLTYCPDGCGASARIMEEANFQKIYDITGGYNRWVSEGFPIVQ